MVITKKFDPEGKGYDYETARKRGMKPDSTGHWSSLDGRTGKVLKGRKHKTFHLTEEEEKERGNKIVKGPEGRYYSVKDAK